MEIFLIKYLYLLNFPSSVVVSYIEFRFEALHVISTLS